VTHHPPAAPPDSVDPRWDESEPRLVEVIRDEILAAPDRRITFARFMERALTEPGLGYYATSQMRPTREGDFLTGPELHPFFGRCFGRQLEEVWERLGRPAPFVVHEHGAGRGTLGASVQAGLLADGSDLAGAIEWIGIDLSGPADEADGEPFAGAVVMNEYVDALPVHRVQRLAGALQEHWIGWSRGWFATVLGPLSSPDVIEPLSRAGIALDEGQIADISLEWERAVRTAPAGLERGVLLIVDYGHPASKLYGPQRAQGSLLGYRQHRVVEDPLTFVGRMDLTAHVDLTAVDHGARAAGLTPLGTTTQGWFLAALGMGDLLRELGEVPGLDPQQYLAARAAVGRFLDPHHLGGFRVVAYGRGLDAEPPLRGLASPFSR
jgi:SAM-dependent MidA family methyltransferase